MATMELPNLKTLVEKTDKGTLNVCKCFRVVCNHDEKHNGV